MTLGKPSTAIVTGAGKRVGRVIAESLLADGWSVVGHVRRADDELPSGAIRAVADLAESDCATRIFDAAAGLPPVTLLVNNAARFRWDDLDSFDLREFDLHMAINARAPLLLIVEFARRHAGDRDALIVNLLDSKLAAPNPDFLSYTLSKHTLAGVTELSARALARKRIRVNGIAPALMLKSAGQSQENFDMMHVQNPLGRGVEPSDVASAIRFLVVSPAITGQTLVIDSGQRFLSLERDVQFLSARDVW